MIAIVRAEWLKLRSTAIPWVLAGISIVITGLLILVYFINHGDGGGGGVEAADRARAGPSASVRPTRTCPTRSSSCATSSDGHRGPTSSPCSSAS